MLQPVADWLHSTEQRTRATAAELEPVMEPALKAARKDKQESVRNAAKASLDRIKKLPKPQKTKTMK